MLRGLLNGVIGVGAGDHREPGAGFGTISPLDHRYAQANPALYRRLAGVLSEEAFIRYQLRVEVAFVRGLARHGACPEAAAGAVEAAARAVTPAEVYAEEARTHHNVRALVNCLQRRVPEPYRSYVHLGLTSNDVLDTARSLQLRDAVQDLLLPLLLDLEATWIHLALRERESLQVGRTHGQHAVPITFGFAVAWYVERLGGRIEALRAAAQRLVGKVAGAVGGYHALALVVADPAALEREVLGELGLAPAGVATQIVPPEPGLDLFHAAVSTFGVLANFADDMRHLQRSEIAEVGEAFEPGQVGSSTMPHKQNPWNFEHVKSLWKTFTPRILTVYLDQISEHQRDLTNSASGRFAVELLAGLALAADRLLATCQRLAVDRARMLANLEGSAHLMAAEPLYVLLAAAGHPGAHERVRELSLTARATRRPLLELAEGAADLASLVARLSPEQRQLLADPRHYTGETARRAEAVCRRWAERLGIQLRFPPAAATPVAAAATGSGLERGDG